MKKIIITLFATALTVLMTVFLGGKYISEIPVVTIYNVEPVTVKDTVICSGTIEYGNTFSAASSAQGILEECYVSSGDKISKGDELFSVLPTNTVDTSNKPSADEVYAALTNGDYDVLKEYENNSKNDNALQTEVKPIKVCASESGTVVSAECSKGEQLKYGEEVMTIASDNNLEVKLNVGEENIGKIALDQPVEITGSAFKNVVFNGNISKIGDMAKVNSTSSGKETTVDVFVSINNPTEQLKSGYTTRCSIITDVKNDTLLIPYDAVMCDDNGSEYIYIYSDGKAVKRNIETINEYNDGCEVSGNISENEAVITNPTAVKFDGQSIKLKEGLVG